MKMYQSKKDPNVTAEVQSYDEKYKTVTLLGKTGPEAGKSFSITSATLKRWWKQIDENGNEIKDEDEQAAEEKIESGEEKTEAGEKTEGGNMPLGVDEDQVNKPYAPDVTPHYVPKPESVEKYEKRQRAKRYNEDLPGFEELKEKFDKHASRVNDTSNYIKLQDKSTVWRKSSGIFVYATEDLGAKLTAGGLIGSANNDKDRPFAFKITAAEEFEKLMGVFVDE